VRAFVKEKVAGVCVARASGSNKEVGWREDEMRRRGREGTVGEKRNNTEQERQKRGEETS
jgi:hypothetical protein